MLENLPPVNGLTLTILLLVVFSLLLIFLGAHTVPDGNARIVERLGRRHRILTPGISIIIPIIDKIKKDAVIETILDNGRTRKTLTDRRTGNVSLAEQRLDPPELKLLGRDNSEIFVDCVAYFRVVEPMKAAYDVVSLADTFMSLVETTLRQEIGKLDGDTVITSREQLSSNLRVVLQEASSNWGIRIMRVELENIRFDEEVTKSLSEARRQELIRRAQVVAAQAEADKAVLEAEAQKKSAILRAEGEQRAQVAIAEGEKTAQVLRAQGEFEDQRLQAEAKFLLQSREQEGIAQGFLAIVRSLSENPEAIIALEALKAQAKVAESLGNSSNTLIVPADAAGLFGAFAAAAKGVGFALNNGSGRRAAVGPVETETGESPA